MKVVIVLPTYNEAENLPLMVEALFGLNIPNLNILVVDDNSPDGQAKSQKSFHYTTLAGWVYSIVRRRTAWDLHTWRGSSGRFTKARM
jgi:dolichol-phosphate mannosyltransferase